MSVNEVAPAEAAEVSDAVVKEKTGHTWPEWFAILDGHGGETLDRRGLKEIISGRYGIGTVWRKLITAAYERARALRQAGERVGELGAKPVRAIYGALSGAVSGAVTETAKRTMWLRDRFTQLQKALDRRPNEWAPVHGTEMTFSLTSSAFGHGEEVPVEITADDADRSPPLSWSDAPAGTKTFALIMDDPDAPDPKRPKRTWVHWLVYDIPATVHELETGASSRKLPPGSHEGHNDDARKQYSGPAPPIGRHRYFIRLYALDTSLGNRGEIAKPALLDAMNGHILAQAELMGTYQRRVTRPHK